MKRLTVLVGMLLLATVVGCGEKQEEDAGREQFEMSRRYNEVMRLYDRAVYDGLWSHVDDLESIGEVDGYDIVGEASKLAGEYLGPNLDLLKAYSDYRLAELPRCELGDLSSWQTVGEPVEGSMIMLNGTTPLFGRFIEPTPEDRELQRNWMLMSGRWNAVSTARGARSAQLVERGTMEMPSVLVEVYGGVRTSVLDADSACPVIVFETGPNIVIVALEWNDDGYYVPTKMESMERKAGSE